ncbi:M16 family metallopeptidase [Clostridium sp. DL1XJH146]
MKSKKLSNGIKIIYKNNQIDLTSICIGLDAGANSEYKNEVGCAHALEHLVYKGTKDLSEKEINNELENVFGFNNAMTNFPYVIYYGSCLKEDMEKAISLFSQLIIYPKLSEEGFDEEINIIKEELNEWKDDPYQLCEDLLMFNAYSEKRIKYPIIGMKESINDITLDKIIRFYKRNYIPENCVISVVSSLSFDYIVEIIEKYFLSWQIDESYIDTDSDKTFSLEESNITGFFVENKEKFNGAKFNYLFSIDNLTDIEYEALKILNYKLGMGINSLLYEKLRTEKGLVYDVSSRIQNEKNMNYLLIKGGTNLTKLKVALATVDKVLDEFYFNDSIIDGINIEKIIKSIELSNIISNEMSIRLAIKFTVNEIMFNDYDKTINIFKHKNLIDKELLKIVLKKVFKNASVQSLK